MYYIGVVKKTGGGKTYKAQFFDCTEVGNDSNGWKALKMQLTPILC